MLDLCIGLGDRRVEPNDALMQAEPPQLGAAHAPIPHAEFFETVEAQLSAMGLTMRQSAHALSRSGTRYFGLAEIVGDNGEYADVLGWRSTHDQKYAASLVSGSGVFVCSNLCFDGEVKVSTRHTTQLRARLPELIRSAVMETRSASRRRGNLFDAMKLTALDDRDAYETMVRMVKADVILPSRLQTVVDEWDNPSHAEFTEDGKTMWRLFNGVTESYKPARPSVDNIAPMLDRSPRLVEFVEAEMI